MYGKNYLKGKSIEEQFLYSIKKGIFINLTSNITTQKINGKTKFENKGTTAYLIGGEILVTKKICTVNLIKEATIRIINECMKIYCAA